MSQHFCHKCALQLGIPGTASTDQLLGQSYQLDKFMKHTTLGTAYPVVSIFSTSGTAEYANYVVSTAGSGWFQVDDQGRHNMVWYAGRQTGAEFRNGTFYLPASGVKVVLYDNQYKIHAFPDAQILPATTCARCRTPIPY